MTIVFDFITQVLAVLGIMMWIGIVWLVVMWFVRGASDASENLEDKRDL